MADPIWGQLTKRFWSRPPFPLSCDFSTDREFAMKANVSVRAKKLFAALVTFDHARTSVQVLTRATADAGYPSELKS